VSGAVLYDLSASQPIGSSPTSGGGAYATRVFQRLLERRGDTPLLALRDTRRPMDAGLLSLARDHGVPVIDFRRSADLLPIVSGHSIATFYSAMPLRFSSLRLPPSLRFIFTIHGLRPLELLTDRYEHRYLYSPRSAARLVAARLLGARYREARKREFARLLQSTPDCRVVAASDHTRFTLLSEFPFLDPGRVCTLYSPAERQDVPPDDGVLRELGLQPQGYFLLICADRWGKNAFRALQAFEGLMRSRDLGKKVLITGQGKAGYLRRYRADNRFIVADYMSPARLEALYRHAFCFVFPTLNEGFGYPPLECMKHGTTVITSPICSLPELLGDAALWANPLSTMELRARILQVLQDATLRDELARRGRERAAWVRGRQDRMLEQLVSMILDRGT